MPVQGWVQIGLFLLVILGVTKPLGAYMYRVFEGEGQPLPRVLAFAPHPPGRAAAAHSQTASPTPQALCEMQSGAPFPVERAREFAWHRRCKQGSAGCPMDLLLVVATVAFFAVSLAYVRGCDRL